MNTRVRPPLAFAGGLAAAALSAAALCAAPALAQTPASPSQPAAGTPITHADHPRFGALPWSEVQDNEKAAKGQFELANLALIVGSVRNQFDVAARNTGMVVDGAMVAALIGARAQMQHVLPLRAALAAGLTQVVDRQTAAAPARADRWKAREASPPADAKASPVVVAVWDSGVDMSLFTSMAAPQVSNLAAKMIALHPALSAVRVKALILEGTTRQGRVNLVDPRGTLARVAPGVKVSSNEAAAALR